VQCSFFHILCRTHFDVVMRKLIFELLACSQCIHETSMLRFHPSIHLKDEVLIRQTMSGDTALHETPHLLALRPGCDNRRLGGDPEWTQSLSQCCSKIGVLVLEAKNCIFVAKMAQINARQPR
jgi:hypothetical protein